MYTCTRIHTHTHIHTHNTHSFFHQSPSSHAHGLIKKICTCQNFQSRTKCYNHHRIQSPSKIRIFPKIQTLRSQFSRIFLTVFSQKKKNDQQQRSPCIFLTLNFAPTVVKTVSKLTKPTHQIFAKLNQSQVPIHLAHAQLRAHCSKDSSNAVCCSLCKKSWPMPGVSYGITKH